MRIEHASKFGLPWIFLFVVGCSSSTDRLIAQLSNPDPRIRRAAARDLGEQQGDVDKVVPALATAIQDDDVEMREAAASALGKIGPRAMSGVPSLERALDDAELSVRVAAALAIQNIEPRNATFVPVVLEALRAGHGPVLLEVAQMGADARWAVPTLAKLLSDQRASIRALAANALGEIRVANDNVKTALERATRDGNPAVRKAAEQALERVYAN